MSRRLRRVLGSFRGRSPAERYWLLQRLRAKLFSRWVGRSFRSFAPDSVLWPPIALWNAGNISIGARVRIAPGARLSTAPGGRLDIGDGTSMMGDTTIHAQQEISIGRKVLIARGVTIVDYQYRFDDPTRPIVDQGRRSAPVRICDGAWLGAGVVVQPGVTIGRSAVVGANSVVKHDVPDHGVAVGAPARIVSG